MRACLMSGSLADWTMDELVSAGFSGAMAANDPSAQGAPGALGGPPPSASLDVRLTTRLLFPNDALRRAALNLLDAVCRRHFAE